MSFAHCAALVRAGDPDRFRAAITAPPDRRGPLLALHALNLEAARAPWAARKPVVALMRLRFWDDALAEILAGGSPRAHPVLEALAPVIRDRALPGDLLRGLVTARAADADPASPPDPESYLAATAGGLMALSVRVLGEPADAAAAALGWAQGAANLLRALPDLAARGRMPLSGVPPADRVALAEGHATPALRAAVRTLAAEGLARHARGLALARMAPRSARPAFRAAWRAGPLLARAARAEARLPQDLGPESEARRRLSLLWRALTDGI